jgi:hypothetical protein
MATWEGAATIMVGAGVIIAAGTNRKARQLFWRPPRLAASFMAASRECRLTLRGCRTKLHGMTNADKENVNEYSTR